MDWKTLISKMLSESDGWPSTRRVLLAIVVAFVLGLATAALCIQRALSPEVVDLLKTALYTTGGALALGKFAETRE